ncbi:MAG: methyltransferase domain-containing protein, partial [Candidatus Aminicenantes bacterium]|nr:methyltransferase domain-containing protein [Candidatus Aminicenantes bacterium]
MNFAVPVTVLDGVMPERLGNIYRKADGTLTSDCGLIVEYAEGSIYPDKQSFIRAIEEACRIYATTEYEQKAYEFMKTCMTEGNELMQAAGLMRQWVIARDGLQGSKASSPTAGWPTGNGVSTLSCMPGLKRAALLLKWLSDGLFILFLKKTLSNKIRFVGAYFSKNSSSGLSQEFKIHAYLPWLVGAESPAAGLNIALPFNSCSSSISKDKIRLLHPVQAWKLLVNPLHRNSYTRAEFPKLKEFILDAVGIFLGNKNIPMVKTVELGSGSGALAKLIKAFYASQELRMFTLDIADLKIPQEQTVAVPHIRASVKKLPFQDRPFNIVISAFVLDYFKDKKEVVREILRIVKPGGRVILLLHHPISLISRSYQEMKQDMDSYYRRTKLRVTDEIKQALLSIANTFKPLEKGQINELFAIEGTTVLAGSFYVGEVSDINWVQAVIVDIGKDRFISRLERDFMARFSLDRVSSPINEKKASGYPASAYANDGFIFSKWNKKPLKLARGDFGKVRGINKQLIEYKFKRPASRVVAEINAKLNEVKKRILEERFFQESDFEGEVVILLSYFRSTTFTLKNQKLQIIIDARAFRNNDLLYLSIKHGLTYIFLKRMLPDLNSAIRELYCNLSVNIKEVMYLRNFNYQRAKAMVDAYAGLANERIGLFRRYRKILAKPDLADAFSREFTEDICLMIAKEKVYFPNIRSTMGKEAFVNNDLNPLLISLLEFRLEQIRKEFLAFKKSIVEEGLFPLTDFTKRKSIPRVVIPFLPFAGKIWYKIEGENIFLKASLSHKNGNIEYAYLYFGLSDNLDLRLGSRGKLFGLTLDKWQRHNPGIFSYAAGKEKERNHYWGYLKRQEITKLIKEIDNYNLSQGRRPVAKHLRGLFEKLFIELNLDKRELNRKSWYSLENIVGKKKGPNSYYAIRKSFIFNYLDRLYPKLLLGEIDLARLPIAELQIYLLTKREDLPSTALNWMTSISLRGPPPFYLESDKISAAEILSRLLKETTNSSSPISENQESSLIVQAAYPIHVRPFDLLWDIARMIKENSQIKIFFEIRNKRGEGIYTLDIPLDEIDSPGKTALEIMKQLCSLGYLGNLDTLQLSIKKDHYLRFAFKDINDEPLYPGEKITTLLTNFVANNIKRTNGKLIDVSFNRFSADNRIEIDFSDRNEILTRLGYPIIRVKQKESDLDVNGEPVQPMDWGVFWYVPKKKDKNGSYSPLEFMPLSKALIIARSKNPEEALEGKKAVYFHSWHRISLGRGDTRYFHGFTIHRVFYDYSCVINKRVVSIIDENTLYLTEGCFNCVGVIAAQLCRQNLAEKGFMLHQRHIADFRRLEKEGLLLYSAREISGLTSALNNNTALIIIAYQREVEASVGRLLLYLKESPLFNKVRILLIERGEMATVMGTREGYMLWVKEKGQVDECLVLSWQKALEATAGRRTTFARFSQGILSSSSPLPIKMSLSGGIKDKIVRQIIDILVRKKEPDKIMFFGGTVREFTGGLHHSGSPIALAQPRLFGLKKSFPSINNNYFIDGTLIGSWLIVDPIKVIFTSSIVNEGRKGAGASSAVVHEPEVFTPANTLDSKSSVKSSSSAISFPWKSPILKTREISTSSPITDSSVEAQQGYLEQLKYLKPELEAIEPYDIDTQVRYAEELGLDSRLIENRLLNLFMLGYYMSIRKIVNPGHLEITGSYGCSGADFSTFALAINTPYAFFYDRTHLNPDRLHGLIYDYEEIESHRLDFNQEIISAYRENKFKAGFAGGIGGMPNLELKITVELEGMGVKKFNSDGTKNIKITLNPDKSVTIRFNWAYFKQEEKTYSIIYMPKKIYKAGLGRQVDIYYQKASYILPSKYAFFLPSLAKNINPGGFLIIDEEKGKNPDNILNGEEKLFTPAEVIHSEEMRIWESLIWDFIKRSLKTKWAQESFLAESDYGWRVHLRQKYISSSPTASLWISALEIATDKYILTFHHVEGSSNKYNIYKNKSPAGNFLFEEENGFLRISLMQVGDIYARQGIAKNIVINVFEKCVKEGKYLEIHARGFVEEIYCLADTYFKDYHKEISVKENWFDQYREVSFEEAKKLLPKLAEIIIGIYPHNLVGEEVYQKVLPGQRKMELVDLDLSALPDFVVSKRASLPRRGFPEGACDLESLWKELTATIRIPQEYYYEAFCAMQKAVRTFDPKKSPNLIAYLIYKAKLALITAYSSNNGKRGFNEKKLRAIKLVLRDFSNSFFRNPTESDLISLSRMLQEREIYMSLDELRQYLSALFYPEMYIDGIYAKEVVSGPEEENGIYIQPDTYTYLRQLSRLYDKTIKGFNKKQGLIWGMHFNERMPTKEIASKLNLKPATVNYHITNCKRILKEKMYPDDRQLTSGVGCSEGRKKGKELSLITEEELVERVCEAGLNKRAIAGKLGISTKGLHRLFIQKPYFKKIYEEVGLCVMQGTIYRTVSIYGPNRTRLLEAL